MAEKILNTRIQLRYDSYANWTSANPVLKKGEVAVATIASGTTQEVNSVATPQVLIKVGDGSSTYSALPFVSAKAADVYAWAKQSELFIDDSATGNVVTDVAWDASLNGGKGGVKISRASVALSTELTALVKRVSAIEADYLKAADKTALENAIALKLDTATFNSFKTENTAAIAAALAEAKEYADTEAGEVNTALETYKTNNDARVKDIEDDYLKAADKTELSGAISSALQAAKDYADNNDADTKYILDISTLSFVGRDSETDIYVGLTHEGDGENAEFGVVGGDNVTVELGSGSEDLKTIRISAVDTKYGIEYDSANRKIKLVEGGSTSEFDASAFVKDGMVTGATLDGTDLVITFNTEAGVTNNTVRVPLNTLVDVYTADNTKNGRAVDVTVSSDKKVSADVVAGSIKTGHLAANAGIVKTQLASDVQASLSKADNAAVKSAVDSAIADINTAISGLGDDIANIDTGVHAVSLASGTNNGTVKLTVDGAATDNIAVKGLKSAAFTESSAYATAAQGAKADAAATQTELNDEIKAREATDDQVATNTTEIAKKANDADLAAIAKTGSVADLVQPEGVILVFDCGDASGASLN